MYRHRLHSSTLSRLSTKSLANDVVLEATDEDDEAAADPSLTDKSPPWTPPGFRTPWDRPVYSPISAPDLRRSSSPWGRFSPTLASSPEEDSGPQLSPPTSPKTQLQTNPWESSLQSKRGNAMLSPSGGSGSYARSNGWSSQGNDPNSKSTSNRSQCKAASHNGRSGLALPPTQRLFQPAPFSDHWGSTSSASNYQSFPTLRTGSFPSTPSWLLSGSSTNPFGARRNSWDGSLASMSTNPPPMSLAEFLEQRNLSPSKPPRLERTSSSKSSAPTTAPLSNHFVIQLTQIASRVAHTLSVATVETMVKVSMVFTVISALIGVVLSIVSLSYLVSYIEDGMEFSQLSARCVKALKGIPAGLQRLLIWRVNLDPVPTRPPWTSNGSGQPEHRRRRPSKEGGRPQPPVLPPIQKSWTRSAASTSRAGTSAAAVQDTYDEPKSVACSPGPMGWAIIVTGIWLAALLSIALTAIEVCASILHTVTPSEHVEKHEPQNSHLSSENHEDELKVPMNSLSAPS